MRELIMSAACGGVFYLLIMQITQCITDGLMGGISEEDAENEPK